MAFLTTNKDPYRLDVNDKSIVYSPYQDAKKVSVGFFSSIEAGTFYQQYYISAFMTVAGEKELPEKVSASTAAIVFDRIMDGSYKVLDVKGVGNILTRKDGVEEYTPIIVVDIGILESAYYNDIVLRYFRCPIAAYHGADVMQRALLTYPSEKIGFWSYSKLENVIDGKRID